MPGPRIRISLEIRHDRVYEPYGHSPAAPLGAMGAEQVAITPTHEQCGDRVAPGRPRRLLALWIDDGPGERLLFYRVPARSASLATPRGAGAGMTVDAATSTSFAPPHQRVRTGLRPPEDTAAVNPGGQSPPAAEPLGLPNTFGRLLLLLRKETCDW